MTGFLEAPGAALVVLRRLATSTDVLLVATPDGRPGVPCAAARAGTSQSALAEDLALEPQIPDVDRLYASTLSAQQDGHPIGVFVGFVDRGDDSTRPEATSHWMDLREACEGLDPAWEKQ